MSTYKSLIKQILPLTFILMSAGSANALTWKENSLLSSGKWAKIKVTENGIHEISYSQLRDLGFEKPESVTVFGYGVTYLNQMDFQTTVPDDLPQVAVLHNNDRILFYAESGEALKVGKKSIVSPVRNNYSQESYYYLTDSQPAYYLFKNPTIPTLEIFQNTHAAFCYNNPTDVNFMRAGVYYFSKDLRYNPQAGQMTFSMPGRVPDSPVTLSGTLLTDEIQGVTISANGTAIASPAIQGQAYIATAVPATIIDQEIIGNKETVDVTVKVDDDATFYVGFEHIGMHYVRENRMKDLPELRLLINSSFSRSQIRILDEKPGDIEVWNITEPKSIVAYELDPETDESGSVNSILTINKRCSSTVPETHHNLIAFRPEARHHKPEIIGMISNQNLHNMETPDMLIITTDACHDQALRLANLHKEYQGMDVAVVRHQDILNEFSSGSPTPMAYRRLAKMFYDRDSEKFRYLLLMGPSIYDYRGLLPYNRVYTPDNMLLSYQVDNITLQCSENTSVSSDAFFGMLHDSATAEFISTNERNGYNNVLVAVGRIPAAEAGEAEIYVDKAEQYLKEGLSAQALTRSLYFADDGDNDMHLISAESVAQVQRTESPYSVATRAHNGIFPWYLKKAEEGQRQIVNALKEGVSLMFYSGHGRADAITGEDIWNRTAIRKTHYECYPLAFIASCNVFGFDRRENSLCENMLFTPNGGSVAVIGTTRSVYNDENRALGEFMLQELSKAAPDDTYGDIFRRARNLNYYDRQYTSARATVNAFNFGGDPALPAFRPAYNITLTTVNGEPASAESSLLPLQKNKFEAQITDAEGNLLTDYNGTAVVSIYESPRTTPNLYSDGTTQNGRRMKEVKVEDEVLCRATFPVVNGVITGELILPEPIRANEKGRITFAAEFPGNNYLNAVGYHDDILLCSTDSEQPAAELPEPRIENLYLNSSSFTDGSLTSPDPVLIAEIKADNNSVNPFGSGMGHAIKAVLDDTQTITDLQYSIRQENDGTIAICHPMSEIPEGKHQLTLYITDIVGNTYSETINFQVVNTTADITLLAENPIATEEITFTADHSFQAEFSARLIITDNSDNHIRTIDNVTFPYTWNMTDTNGKQLTTGSYTARVMATDGISYCGSPLLRFTVIR